jgi:hypothetical protein
MKIHLLIFMIAQMIFAQDKMQIPCSSLLRTDSTHLMVPGLIDHNELNPTWIKEKIDFDSIDVWCKKQSSIFTSEYLSRATKKEVKKQSDRHLRWLRKEFKKLIPFYRTGDTIWYYTTPDSYWNSLAGQDGILLMRNCTLIVQIILMQS